MKKLTLLFSIFILLFSGSVYAAEPQDIPGNTGAPDGVSEHYPTDGPNITGYSAIVMDMDTMDILYEQDPHHKGEPASTTKLMTAILAVDKLSPTDNVTITESIKDNLIEDAVVAGLIPGEVMPAKELLYAMLLPSANDAANALGTAVSGSLSAFAEAMNAKAAELGCVDTHFTNANGLPDENHVTTVYDMALIAREAYSRSRIRDVLRTESYWLPATNLSGKRELWTTNELLYNVTDLYYEYCTGGKTGYTGDAGYTMVAFGEKDNRRLVSVVFGCPTSVARFQDAAALLEYGFSAYHMIYPLKDYQLIKASTDPGPLTENYYAGLEHFLPEFTFDASTRIYTRSNVTADDIEKTLTLYPQSRNGAAGEIGFAYQGRHLGSVPIQSANVSNPEVSTKPQLSFEPKITTKPKTEETKTTPMVVILLLGGIVLAGLLIGLLTLFKNVRAKKRVRLRRYTGGGNVELRNAAGEELSSKRLGSSTRTIDGYEDEIPTRKKTEEPAQPQRSSGERTRRNTERPRNNADRSRTAAPSRTRTKSSSGQENVKVARTRSSSEQTGTVRTRSSAELGSTNASRSRVSSEQRSATAARTRSSAEQASVATARTRTSSQRTGTTSERPQTAASRNSSDAGQTRPSSAPGSFMEQLRMQARDQKKEKDQPTE